MGTGRDIEIGGCGCLLALGFIAGMVVAITALVVITAKIVAGL